MPDGYRTGVRSVSAGAGTGATILVCVQRPSATFPTVGSIRRLDAQFVAQCRACAAIAGGIGSRSLCRHAVCWAGCGVAPKAPHNWKRLDKRLQHRRIVNVSSRYLCHQWQAPLVDDNVMFAAELAAIGRVWSSISAAQGGGDGTLAESILARSHWI